MNSNAHDAQRRITEHFDEFAVDYHDAAFDGAGMAALSRRDLEVVDRVCDAAGSSGRACDVGVGSGRISDRLIANGFDISGVDVSEAMLEQARNRLGPDVELVQASLTDGVPLPTAEFALVTCLRVLKYLPAWPDAIVELARLAQPGGVVCFDLVNQRSAARFGYPDGMVWPTSQRAAIDATRAAGLEIVEIVPGVHLPDPVWRGARSDVTARGARAAEAAASWLLRGVAARSWTFITRRAETDATSTIP